MSGIVRRWLKMVKCSASHGNADALQEERDHWQKIAKKVRAFAAYRFIKGDGIEIGALNHPLKVYKDARVRYIDRLTTEEALRAYPELAGEPPVDVDVIDDGETLRSVGEGSCDFVIANHMLEHCRNPIGAIENMLRALRPEGILFLAIPDKRFTFDAPRPVTPYGHIVRDYFEGPESSDEQHYKETTKDALEFRDAAERRQRIAQFFAARTNVHFHTWTQREIIELFLNVKRDFGFELEIEFIARTGAELVIVLRKVTIPDSMPSQPKG